MYIIKYNTFLYSRHKNQIILKGKIYIHIYIYTSFFSIHHLPKRDCLIKSTCFLFLMGETNYLLKLLKSDDLDH